MKHALPVTVLLAALTACSGQTPDGARIERMRAAAAEQAGFAAELDPLLSEATRARRWREEQARWAAMKAATAAELATQRENAIVKVMAERQGLLAQLLELRRSGALAPAGKLPPALELIQEENRLGLRNATGKPLNVQASQLIANASGYPLGHCGFEIYDAQGKRRFDDAIAPQTTVYLRISPAWYCRDEKKTTLEAVVWRDEQLVWITETRVHELLNLPPESVEEVLRRAAQARHRPSGGR
jgi:hypothetical protein